MTVVRDGPTSASRAKKTRKATALHSTPSTTTATQAEALTSPTPSWEKAANGAYASADRPIATAETARLGSCESLSVATSGPEA